MHLASICHILPVLCNVVQELEQVASWQHLQG